MRVWSTGLRRCRRGVSFRIPLSYVPNKICKRGCDVMLVLYGAVCDVAESLRKNGQGSKVQSMHVGKTGCVDGVTAGE